MGLSFLWPLKELQAAHDQELASILPIDRGRADDDVSVTGDLPHQAHKILWSIQAGEGSLPKIDPLKQEQVKVAIIGGGCAGLSAAWKLRDLKPVILEQASRLGGNAKGETWRGVPYSIGAAYLCRPDEGSEIDRFLKEIGALDQLRVSHHEARFLPKGEGIFPLSKVLAAAPAQEREAWERFIKALKKSLNEEGGQLFPEIPTDDPKYRALLNQMDQEDFATLCARLAGGELPRVLKAYLEQYCWTAFGAGMNEISAASGLNFLAGELNELLVGPGGNSWITEQVSRKLASELGMSHLRVNSLVYHVEATERGVLVSYMDGEGQPRQLLAERVILSCPKFVVKRILKGIEPKRLAAIQQLKYRAYLVHQALIKGQLKDDFYELFLIGEGSEDRSLSIVDRSKRAGVTDLTYGNFAAVSAQHTILSLYQALPYDAGRSKVYQDLELKEQRASTLKHLKNEILPALKLAPDSLLGLRSSRWGHPLPVAMPKLIQDGVIDELRSPHKDWVFFAQQDNWALPAIEVSLYEGMKAAQQLRDSL